MPRKSKPVKKVKRDPDISATDEDAELTTDEEHYFLKSGKLKEKFTYEGRQSPIFSQQHHELTTY